MSKVHLARSGFITKAALPSITRQRGTTTGTSTLMLFGAGKTTVSNNTTFIDSSTNAFTVTRVGDTVHSGHNPFSTVSDGSAYFDGTGDWLTLASNTAFDQTVDFTVEAFVFFRAVPTGSFGNYGLIFGQESSNMLKLGTSSTGSGVFAFGVTKSGVGSLIVGTTSVSLNTWYHVALVKSGTGTNNIKLYVNGTQEGQATGGTAGSSTTVTYIGREGWVGDPAPLNGYVSNLRVVKGTAVYTANFTPPTSALTAITNTQLLLLTDNYSIVNSTPTPLPITIGGSAAISTAQYPTGMTKSIFINGNSNYVDIAGSNGSANFTFGTGDVTIELFAYHTTLSGTQNYYRTQGSGANAVYLLRFTANTIQWLIYDAVGTLLFSLTSSASLTSANTWYHIAAVRYGNVHTIYLNGVSIGTSTVSYSAPAPQQDIGIGRGNFATGENMVGYISNYRIAKGTAVYTANFTPPSTPLSVNISVPAYVTNAIYGVNQLA